MNPHPSKPKIIVICGPTAVGKTSFTIGLAQKFNGQIINADSRQIYRLMNIGTAKPTPEEQTHVPHHLIDVVNPDEPFDAKQFARLAGEAAAKMFDRNVIPFVAGGTGLYIKAMLYGLFEEHPSQPSLRRALKKENARKGSRVLHERLKRLDPDSYSRIHPNDAYRIIRALEVYEITGKTISQLHQEHQFSEKKYDVIKFGLYLDRAILYDRIDRRVDMMISKGLAEEVRGLLQKGYSSELKSMKAIGYSHMVEFFENKISWKEAVNNLKRDTRRYAKRQLTWFRADPDILWVKPTEHEAIVPLIDEFLKEAAF